MRILVHLLLVCYLGMGLVCGQTDSLMQALEQSSTNSRARVDALNQLTTRLVYSRPDSTIDLSLEAINIAEGLGYTEGLAVARNRLGAGYWSKGDLEEALLEFQRSESLAKAVGDTLLWGRNIGNKGIIYAAVGDNRRAIRYYRESLLYFKNYKERTAVTYNNMGKSYLDLGSYDSAGYYLHRVPTIAQEYAPLLLPIATFNLGDLYFRQGQDERATVFLERCRHLSDSLNDGRATIRAKQLLAEIYLRQGDITAAETLAKAAVRRAEQTYVRELMYICYGTLSKVLAQKKDFQDAYLYQKLYISTRDSVRNRDTENRLDFSEYERKQQEIQILEKQYSYQRKANYLLIGGLVVSMVFIVIFLWLQWLLQRQNQRIAEQAQSLQDINSAKDKLFSILSHDLRSPLNSLNGLLEIAALDQSLSEKELRDMLNKISDRSIQTSAMLDNLLDWARSQMGGFVLKPEQIDVYPLVEEKIKLIDFIAKKKNIQFQNQLAPTLTLWADKNAFQFVIRNLLSNAVKFSYPGGVVVVSAQVSEQSVTFLVRDEGVGIAPDKIEAIFENKGISSRGTNNEKGTGLGLGLCREFVEAHEGKIWAESQIDHGTKVYFLFPNKS